MEFLTEQLANWRFYLIGSHESGPVGGLAANLLMTLASLLLGSGGGVVLGLGRLSRKAVLRVPCAVAVETLRSIPALLLVFWCALFVPGVFGSRISLFMGAVFGLSLHAAAYLAEIVRGGILAVPIGQFEAALASGLTRLQAARLVVLPQALRLSIPAFSAFLISLFKDTSLVYIIGVVDLTQAGIIVSQRQPNRMAAAYICMALGFFVVCRCMAMAARWMEKRFSVAGYPQQG